MVCTSKFLARSTLIAASVVLVSTAARADTWTFCIHGDHTRNDCPVVPSSQACPDGYGKGGISWATKEEACKAPTTACDGGRPGC